MSAPRTKPTKHDRDWSYRSRSEAAQSYAGYACHATAEAARSLERVAERLRYMQGASPAQLRAMAEELCREARILRGVAGAAPLL